VTETDSPRILQASLALSAYLLEAHDEESALRAVMRVGCDVIGADGCLFIPFDEFLQRLSPLEFGRVPALEAGLLSAPSQRQMCKVCEARRAGSECALLHMHPAGGFVYCVPLRARGREAGLFSFIFAAEPRVDEETEWFLAEAMRLVELALDARERDSLPLGSAMEYLEKTPALTEEMQSLLPQIELRAILGERTRLAREIHDGLAQTLAFLKIEIGRAEKFIAQGEHDRAARILKDSSRTISDAYLDARQAIENLRRAPDGRLETWLHQVADDFELLTGLPVEVDARLTSDFPPNLQVQMIRIVQEALTNIRRHAAASHVRLSAREEQGSLVIEVADDGRGFSPEEAVTAARFGLRGMRERAESIGADFQITSCPENGTTVRLHIPLHVGVKS